MKMRVADYITQKIYDEGGEHVSLITGGMIMHLTDALFQNKKQTFTCYHNEQSVAMAAEAYGRFTGKLGVAYVTAGPAALNTLNGVVGAYVDRSPCVIISGQSKLSQAKVTEPRQFALQGYDTLPIFKHATKYAVMLDDISRVKYEMEKALHIAKSHPVGPVWIECPVDIQGATFDPGEYEGYIPKTEDPESEQLHREVDRVLEYIKESKRPCLLLGAGVRMAGAADSVNELMQQLNIPVLTSRLGMDIVGYDDPLFVGRPGTYGDRPANFTIQNSDLLISIGCRLSIGLVGYDYQTFAPKAKKIVVDIDEKELNKPSVIPDMPIKADARVFIELLKEKSKGFSFSNQKWIEQTQEWKHKYPVNLPEYSEEIEGINSYYFTTLFSEKVNKDAVFVLDSGSCFHVHGQAFKVKTGQRHIITGGLSTMGYMPAAIGVAMGAKHKEVYCVTGDGSIQMNIQELATIAHNKLPIKLIVFNNNGYLLVRHTQNNFMEGRLIGESASSGLSFPDLEKIAKAYGIDFMRISDNSELDEKIDILLDADRALICEVMTPSNQLLIPRVASKKLDDGTMVSMPYDDMFPFLPREEYESNQAYDKV